MADPQQKLLDLGEQVVEKARKAGADVAEAAVGESAHLSTKVRLGEPELVEEASTKGVGLRVMIGQQVAVTHTSDLTSAGIDRFVQDAVELARLAQPDPFAGPPDASLLSSREEHVDLDLYDDGMQTLDAGKALQMAKDGEAAAMGYDKRLSNSEGATVARVAGASALVTSGGFRGSVRRTTASIVVVPVVEDEGGKKRRGAYWSSKRHLAQLEGAEAVGEEAARRTLAKLGARKVETQEAPVIFDPDSARGMVGLVAGCVLGGAVWRRSSYLAERLGDRIASDLVTIIDDPFVERGPGSRSFDGEGLKARRNVVVQDGVLQQFLLDSYSGRKLDKPSTASASRGGAGGVSASISNFVLQPGSQSADDLVASTERGLYVTDMMGFGFNAVTGDFSPGASGFWIENGEKAFPVSEVTISLNLDSILQRIDAVANDLDLRASVASPTFRVSRMTIAGK